MQQTTQADDLVMGLVEQVLALPAKEREAYLRNACGTNDELFGRAWKYVQWEERMGGFLLDPFYQPAETDSPFELDQLLISRFRIVRKVAQGGMGIVWEAMDQKLDRRVAIKCAKAGFGKELPPEVRNARDISHPNVCKIFEIHTAPSPLGEIDFISMEFIEGETLSERLRQGRFSKRECLGLALQLCAGLSEAHRNNVIHGDFKSNNVMLTATPAGSLRAVIMDFGLARRLNVLSQNLSADSLAGTPTYMAPELWKGAKPSVASDIYALGVVLWEVISGRTPGDLGAASSTLSWDERPSWKPPTGYGKWDRILACCLQADPARRFHSVEDVARALGPPRSRKWFLAAAIAAVLAVISGAVTYQRATAPAQSVRLAVLPFASGSSGSALSKNLFRDTASQLARLKSDRRTRLTFIPVDTLLRNRVDTPEKARTALGATHVLQGKLEPHGQTITVRAYLTDMRSGVNARDWTAEYKPGEMQYAPLALAGLVTGTLHLPLAAKAAVNAAARPDYLAGLSAVHRDSEVDIALARFTRARAADPASPLPYAGSAEAQWFKHGVTGEPRWLEAAAESVRQAEIRNTDLAEVHSIAGLLKANEGWYEQAVSQYLRAIELDPVRGDAYRRLGQAYEANNQLEEALAAFRKAVEVEPQQYRNLSALGFYYYQRASYDEAATYNRRAVALAPKEALVHYSLGTVQMDLGHFSIAEDELRLSLRLQRTAAALHALGLLRMYQQQELQAIPIIKSALKLGPEQSLWWMNLGTAYRRSGQLMESKRAYRRGLELAQTEMPKKTRNGSERAHLAYLCSQLGDPGRAASDIAQALQESPNDADARWMGAITYEALGRHDDAISVLAASPPGVVADVGRWPDVAGLRKDPRFLQLLPSQPEK